MNNSDLSIQHLKPLLADTYTLTLKTQFAHWNITGPNFYSLHKLFEEQYQNMQAAVDEIAERIRALGAMAPASWREYRELTSLEEANNEFGEHAILTMLKNDHTTLTTNINQVMTALADNGDEASMDLLIRRADFHDKTLWMLTSSLA